MIGLRATRGFTLSTFDFDKWAYVHLSLAAFGAILSRKPGITQQSGETVREHELDWFIVIAPLIVIALFLGGTVRILISGHAPLPTRLRWAAVSVAPVVFMVLVLAISTPSGSSGPEGELGFVGEFFTGMLGMAVIAANWMTHSTYRSSLSKSVVKTT